MIYEIKNSTTSIKVDTFGAQMTSFCIDGKEELLWQGNPEFWTGQSPVLFPIVGALRESKAIINGEWCEISKHGFAKLNEFEMVEQTENSLEFELVATEKTKKIYPFEFSFKVKFELGDKIYKTIYSVQNKDTAKMPFCVGAHPAFNVPFEDGYTFDDYIIEFAVEEDISCPMIITETSIYDYSATKMEIGKAKSFKLNKELFYNDVMVFENLNENQISIKNPKTGKAIEMKFADLPMIGVWKPYNDAPFVCLEPWLGSSTTTLEDDEFTNKKHSKVLNPEEKMEFSFTVEYK